MKILPFLLFLSVPVWGQVNYPRGIIWEDAVYDSLPLKADYGRVQDLPQAVSLSAFFPSVINQSTIYNNGVGWALSWYAFTALDTRNTGQNANQDPRKGFSAAFTYRMANPGSTGCDHPVSMVNALKSMTKFGVPRFADFEEMCADSIPPSVNQKALDHRLSGFVKLFNTFDPKDQKIAAVKKALNEQNPVVVGMICPPSFSLAKEFWQPHEDPVRDQGGHAICITGYNDLKYGGAFQVVNSWGRTWGNDGYTWIPYNDFYNFVQYGFELYLTRGPLNGFLQFVDAKGTPLKVSSKNNSGYYQLTGPLHTGDLLRLVFTSEADIFVRFLFVDAKGQVMDLYPGPHIDTKLADKSLYLPDETGTYTLTEPSGVGHFIMLVAKTQFDLRELEKKINSQRPADVLLSNSFLAFDPNKVRFAARYDDAGSAVVVVDIDQN